MIRTLPSRSVWVTTISVPREEQPLVARELRDIMKIEEEFDAIIAFCGSGGERKDELMTSVARGIYLRLPDDTRLWQRGGSFEAARHSRLVELFS